MVQLAAAACDLAILDLMQTAEHQDRSDQIDTPHATFAARGVRS